MSEQDMEAVVPSSYLCLGLGKKYISENIFQIYFPLTKHNLMDVSCKIDISHVSC